MKHIGPIKHPVKLLNNKVVEFNFDYFESDKGRYAVSYIGEIKNRNDLLLRIESSCIFGHVFGVVRCDCQYQLAQAMMRIAKNGSGMVIYAIDQDCRGLGIAKHFEVYVLRQKENLNTKEVYERLKAKPDAREYDDVVDILKFYDIKGVHILTNNPRRLDWLKKSNIKYERIPLEITLNDDNYGCLMDEKDDLGYLFSFKSHSEWFKYINEKNKNKKQEREYQGCVITNNYKDIVYESFDFKADKMQNKKISTNEDGETKLNAYFVGDNLNSYVDFFKNNNVNHIYIKKENEKLDIKNLSDYGIKVDLI